MYRLKTSTKNTLITAGVTLIVGIIGGSKLNINQTITTRQEDGNTITYGSKDIQTLKNQNNEMQEYINELNEKLQKIEQDNNQSNLSNNQLDNTDSNSELETKNNSDYLLDLVKPYEYPYWFTEYNGQTFDMGGDSYTHGFTCMGYGNENEGNVIFFNLHGKYSKMSFIAGVVHRSGIFSDEDNDCVITFYADDKLVDTVVINPNNLPSEHEVNINYCQQLKICIYDGKYVADGSGTYGFAEVKIF